MSSLFVFIPEEGESPAAFLKRAELEKGSLVLVLTGIDLMLAADKDLLSMFIDDLASISSRVRIATKQRKIMEAARNRGIRVVGKLSDLQHLLEGHRSLDDAVHAFSPHVWQQKLRSNLQSMGLLSLPRIRIWILIGLSLSLFSFVFLRLLPSATVHISPREDTISQTANIFLVLSGATVDIPKRVRTLELMPIVVSSDQTLTFDQISKEFIGTSARVVLTMYNDTADIYPIRKWTRVMNQAGMVFRIQDPIVLDPGERISVRAEADDHDLYNEIIGERGNVPEGLRWKLPGLSEDEQKLVYAINSSKGFGGTTAFRTVLHQGDLDIATKKLEQDLLATVKQLVDEQRLLYNAAHLEHNMEILYYDELTKTTFTGFVLPLEFLGEPVTSIPVKGSVVYTAYAYNSQKVLNLLSEELYSHVEDGKRLLEDSVTLERLIAHVIDYNDKLSWIKLTVDLSGTEQFILDPLSPTGAKFAKRIREMITGKESDIAERIIKNLPEVRHAEVSIWPPWNSVLPHIPSHIVIEIDS
ncbi:MAG: hypothetical protein O2904_00440 [bacterium]|nr:hypothetical protein [bacterium]